MWYFKAAKKFYWMKNTSNSLSSLKSQNQDKKLNLQIIVHPVRICYHFFFTNLKGIGCWELAFYTVLWKYFEDQLFKSSVHLKQVIKNIFKLFKTYAIYRIILWWNIHFIINGKCDNNLVYVDCEFSMKLQSLKFSRRVGYTL